MFESASLKDTDRCAPGKKRKRVALKYCGGCDPGYDRVEYFRKIQNAGEDLIEWVTMEDNDFEAILVISGCDTACPAENMGPANFPGHILISVRDDNRSPAEIIESLLSKEKP